MSNISMPNSGGGGSKISLPSQTIDGGLSAGQPAYLESGTWKKAEAGTSPATGFYIGSSEIVLMGRVTGLSGLTADETHYLANTGGLTDDPGNSVTKTKIGYAESTSILLVDIDVESNLLSTAGLLLTAGNYHWTMRSSPVSANGNRSSIQVGDVVPNFAAHFWLNDDPYVVNNGFESFCNIIIGGVLDHTATVGPPNNHLVGTLGGDETRCGQRFAVSNGGTLDSIEIKVNVVDGSGATNVLMEVREEHSLGSGTLVASQGGVTLNNTGTFTFSSFVAP